MPVVTLELTPTSLGEPVAEAATALAALRGDREAWNVLVARHTPRVVVALVARGVLPAQAREFAQDAWLKLVERAAAGQLATLELPGLAIRQATFLARSAGRRPDALLQADADAAWSGPDAEARYASKEALARAQARLATMHPSSRRVFELLYGEPPHEPAEAAQVLGLSVQRVRQIVCEVRKVLRRDLDEGAA